MLLSMGVAGAAISVVFLASWAALHGVAAIESPLLWVALAAFWGAAYTLVYARELGRVERALAALKTLEPFGVRIYWLRAPNKGGLGGAIEVRARSKDDLFPVEIALFLNVNLLFSLHVVGVRCSWSCRETGVLFLTPKRSRFLGGATSESLGLPTQEGAALRLLLKPPGDPGGPDWGAPAGAHARRAFEEVAAESWLFGPEQPFLAFEATEGAIEKFWSPVASRMVDLDVESALDLLRVVRAFDRDTIAARGGAPTSSPSSLRSSSPRP